MLAQLVPCEICSELVASTSDAYNQHLGARHGFVQTIGHDFSSATSSQASRGNATPSPHSDLWTVQLGQFPALWWGDFDTTISRELSIAYENDQETYRFWRGKHEYEVDFNYMVQRNLSIFGSAVRFIRRPRKRSEPIPSLGAPAATACITDAVHSDAADEMASDVLEVVGLDSENLLLPHCDICGCSVMKTELADHLAAHKLQSEMTEEDLADAPDTSPAPKEEMVPGTEWFINPLEIRFTHDYIREVFRPFDKDGERYTNWSILDSIRECLKKEEPPQLQEGLGVVWHDGQIYVAGTYNRRLCMYRLLAIFRPKMFRFIRVVFHDNSDLSLRKMKFFKKLSTKCEGTQIEVGRGTGRFVGLSRDEVTWKEALELLDPCSSPPAPPGNSASSGSGQASSTSFAAPAGVSDGAPPSKKRKLDAPHGENHVALPRMRAGLCGNMGEVKVALAALVGTWKDKFDSRYEVTACREGALNVRTTRPDAKGQHCLFKETRDLIRIALVPATSGCYEIAWDRSFVLQVSSPMYKDLEIIRWAPRGRRMPFMWTRC